MRIMLKDVIISYPKLFKPDEKGKFGAAFVFTKGQEAQVKAYAEAAKKLLAEKFGKDESAKMIKSGKVTIAGRKHSSVRTDVDRYESINGIAYVNARTPDRPTVVSIYPDPTGKKNSAGKPAPAIVSDEKAVFAGNVVNASITLFYKDVDGNAGVWAVLNSVQKVRDGDVRLDSRVSATEEFEVDADALAKLEDLTGEDSAEAEESDDLSDLLN